MMVSNKNKYKIYSKESVSLPGYIMKYGINKKGRIYALIRKEGNKNWYNRALIGISKDGDVLWTSALKIEGPNELRIAKDGKCYVSFSKYIYSISEDGEIEETILIQLEADQEIGSFAILKDCFIICVQGKEGPNSIVIKTDLKGNLIWATKIPCKDISYEGIIEMRADNDWKAERKKGWCPRNWLCLTDNEIIVSNNTILVSYCEMPGSGIGKSYLLSADSGMIKWHSKPAPYESISCLGDGMFLIGSQGYGAFETQLINENGDLINQWNSVGKTVVAKDKEISLIEMDNAFPSELYHTKLFNEGEISKGAQIPGYYIIYPALDELGSMIFWRNNELTIVDKKSNKYTLLKVDFMKQPYTSNRILLYDQGEVYFSLNKELYILKTNLGRLDKSSWACKFGNNERNPVIEKDENWD